MNRRLSVQLFIVISVIVAAGLAACAPMATPQSTTVPPIAPAVEPTVSAPEPPQPIAPAFNDRLPDACRVADHALYVNPFDGYCFAYPPRYELQAAETGQPVLYGPALDQQADALRASLLLEVEVAIENANLTQIVDAYLSQFANLNAPAITRSAIVLGGEPAEMLEVVPGREGSRDVFALHAGTLYHFMFMPSVRDFPQAKTDVEELYAAITTSFTFTSKKPHPIEQPGVSASPRDPSITGVVRWGAAPVADAIAELRTGDWRVNANATLQRAMTDPEGRYTLINPPAGDYVMCGLFPDGTQENSKCTPVHVEAGQDVPGLDVMLVRELSMLEPAANAPVSTLPVLRWNSFPGAARYEVFIIDAGTTELLARETVSDSVFAVAAPLTPNRTYTWVVNALTVDGGLLADATGDMTVQP